MLIELSFADAFADAFAESVTLETPPVNLEEMPPSSIESRPSSNDRTVIVFRNT